MRVFIHGDTHGNFDFLPYFCQDNNTTKEDILIIAGDCGILFYGANKQREKYLKEFIQNCPITLLCVRGNHDDRPQNRFKFGMVQHWDDRVEGEVYVDLAYPDILFALDGGEYVINDRSFLTIGGAYSVDKYYRLMNHWTWFEDEQLTSDEMLEIFHRVKGTHYDYVISHTCPYDWMPVDLFISGIEADNTMEKFLQKVMENINYYQWFYGHYHSYRDYGNHILLYNNYVEVN